MAASVDHPPLPSFPPHLGYESRGHKAVHSRAQDLRHGCHAAGRPAAGAAAGRTAAAFLGDSPSLSPRGRQGVDGCVGGCAGASGEGGQGGNGGPAPPPPPPQHSNEVTVTASPGVDLQPKACGGVSSSCIAIMHCTSLSNHSQDPHHSSTAVSPHNDSHISKCSEHGQVSPGLLTCESPREVTALRPEPQGSDWVLLAEMMSSLRGGGHRRGGIGSYWLR